VGVRGVGKLRAWVIVVVSLCAFVLLAVAAPARASTALPKWSAGDYWSYDLTVNTVPFGPASGKWRMDVVGTDSLNIGGTAFDAYHLKDNVSMTYTYGGVTLTLTAKGDSWYRTSDLALARQTVVLSFGTMTSTTTTTNIPPPSYQWPLTAGATWSQSYETKTFVDFGSTPKTFFANVTKSVMVQADTSITVPAGTFTVNRVTESGGGNTSTSSWSEKAGNKVASESTSPSGPSTESMKLNSYQYAAGSSTVGGLFLGLDAMTLTIIIVVAAGIIAVAAVGMARRSRRKRQAPPPPPMVQDMTSAPISPAPGERPPPKT
jgi:hypothetical protein